MAKRVVETRTVDLGGEKYEFRVPKVAGLILALMSARNLPEVERDILLAGEQVAWLKKGLGDQWTKIEGRLEDDDDVLDFSDLVASAMGLVGEVADRPPTSSTAS